MKKLGYFKSSLLMSAVALSLLSSSANAVSEEVVRGYLIENCGNARYVGSDTILKLMALDDAQWEQFKVISGSLKTNDMTQYSISHMINSLITIPKDKFFHPRFLTIVQSFNGSIHSPRIAESLGRIDPEMWDRFLEICKHVGITSSITSYQPVIIDGLSKMSPDHWGAFLKFFPNFLREDMSENDCSRIIWGCVLVKPEHWDRFKEIVEEHYIKDRNEDYIQWTIPPLAGTKIERLSDPRFIEAYKTLTMNLNGQAGCTIALSMQSSGVPMERLSEFVQLAQSFLTESITDGDWSTIVDSLFRSRENEIDRVYLQIQRFMRETQGKIQFGSYEAPRELIWKLKEFTGTQAQDFTTELIQLVNGDQGIVRNDRLLTHINTAFDRMRGRPLTELQELANQRQNTHKSEVHASVAESLRKLQDKYKGRLPKGDIFELMHACLMSVFPDNMQDLLKHAVAFAKTLVNPQDIENILKISPHARAGEGDSDTELNLAARQLWAGKSPEATKAIQDVVTLHSHKNDLADAEKLLQRLKDNPEFQEGITRMGYEELFRLIYAAITDESWGNAQDIPDRWRSLMTRMARAKNEYSDGSDACLAGTFNALLEPLSRVHPDVLIIMSFRAMMQEVSGEEDDDEFKRQVHMALSGLGENARQNRDYVSDIEAFTSARIDMIESDLLDPRANPKYQIAQGRQEQLDTQKRAARGKTRKWLAKRVALQKLIAEDALRDAKTENHVRRTRMKSLGRFISHEIAAY